MPTTKRFQTIHHAACKPHPSPNSYPAAAAGAREGTFIAMANKAEVTIRIRQSAGVDAQQAFGRKTLRADMLGIGRPYLHMQKTFNDRKLSNGISISALAQLKRTSFTMRSICSSSREASGLQRRTSHATSACKCGPIAGMMDVPSRFDACTSP